MTFGFRPFEREDVWVSRDWVWNKKLITMNLTNLTNGCSQTFWPRFNSILHLRLYVPYEHRTTLRKQDI